MERIKTYPRGQRKEFRIRVMSNILVKELKVLYKMRIHHEKIFSTESKNEIIEQAKYCKSLCYCVNCALQDFCDNHAKDPVLDCINRKEVL